MSRPRRTESERADYLWTTNIVPFGLNGITAKFSEDSSRISWARVPGSLSIALNYIRGACTIELFGSIITV